ncbi:hypothetical protein [Lactobacillus delbrueckii]|uniref:hypothetical protein n=1 Tax=Lactobacillus delbrueckii TaxID=1584 RepID=UPI001E5A9272|nr:hypothetical protein [Lactobacillus delbrueckii]MCD5445435.1 hypothetical protein [Lactobacillus delbrueckii subsp. lactis]
MEPDKTTVEPAAPVKAFTPAEEPTYAKSGLTGSDLFNRTERDILEITLEDGKTYTVDQAKAEIKKFKEGM